MDPKRLAWQSKLILTIVIAPVAISVAWQLRFWAIHETTVLAWTLGLSALLGILAWKSRSATPAAAVTGALIAASMMFSTFAFPYHPWNTALVPILTVLVLTSLATRFGRSRKQRLGTAEAKHGRNAAQVCANLGFAALICTLALQSGLSDLIAVVAYACLAEAAADTISSEIGQVLGGQPFLLTTLRRTTPGTDGAISAAGTLAGILASGIVAAICAFALNEPWIMACIIGAGGVFGLFFDSLLGAAIERHGWLNNDAVNFLSTASAALFAIVLLAWLFHGVVI